MEESVHFRPVKRAMLPDMVIGQIKQMIMDGQLRSGDRLPSELELADQFGVGRTSIREAIKALSLMGLLTRTNVGTFVNSDVSALDTEYLTYRLLLQKSTPSDIYETRKFFEGHLAALAAKRASPEAIAALEGAIERAEAVRGDRTALFETDMEFHMGLAKAAGNAVMYNLYTVVYEIMSHWFDEVWSTIADEALSTWSTQNHRRILAAIKRGDVEDARMEAHRSMSETEQKLAEILARDERTEKS